MVVKSILILFYRQVPTQVLDDETHLLALTIRYN